MLQLDKAEAVSAEVAVVTAKTIAEATVARNQTEKSNPLGFQILCKGAASGLLFFCILLLNLWHYLKSEL